MSLIVFCLVTSSWFLTVHSTSYSALQVDPRNFRISDSEEYESGDVSSLISVHASTVPRSAGTPCLCMRLIRVDFVPNYVDIQ